MTRDEWLESSDPAEMLHCLVAQSVPGNVDGVVRRPSDRKLRLFACACWRALGEAVVGTARNHPEVADCAERWADSGERPAELPHFGYPLERDAFAAASGMTSSAAYLGEVAVAALLREVVGDPFAPVTLPTKFSRCARCDGKGWIYQGAPADDDEYACSGCGRPAGLYGHYSERSKTMECPKEDCRACAGRGAVALCPWVTADALSIAQAAYDERQSDGTLDPLRLAVLADALEEAGCPSEVPCGACKGSGVVTVYPDHDSLAWDMGIASEDRGCGECGGAFGVLRGRDGTGRVPHPLIGHLRPPGQHVRGCFALDLILGKE